MEEIPATQLIAAEKPLRRARDSRHWRHGARGYTLMAGSRSP